MRRLRTKSGYLLFLCLLGGALPLWGKEIFLEARPGFKKIPLGLFTITGVVGDEGEDRPTDILKKDLERSQIFLLEDLERIGIKAELSATPPPDLIQKAGQAGINALVWGQFFWRDGDLIVEGRLYETTTQKMAFAKRYVGSRQTLRAMIHRFADELVFHYTGEKGIASTRIAFISDGSGQKEIHIMDYDGHNEVRVTGDRSIILSPRWSPDGMKLAYTSFHEKNPDIFLLDLGTARRQKFISLGSLNITPAWSPKGDRIAFSTSKDGNTEIYTVDLAGENMIRLTFNSAEDLSPSWSPTGTQIAFTSDRGGSPQIYVMDADGMHVRRVTFEGEYNTSPAWSPTGERIAYTCRASSLAQKRLRICLVSPDGSGAIQVTGNGSNEKDGRWDDESPAWSPDGRHIIFSSNREGKGNIYMVNIDGSGLERLTFNGANNTSPVWSPN